MKRLVKRLSPLLLVAFLAGCNSALFAVATSPVSKADIAAVEVTLTETIRVANACLAMSAGPCTDAKVRTPLIADVHAAHDAFKRLQVATAVGASAAMAALQEAIRQLTSATPATPVVPVAPVVPAAK